MRFKGQVSTFLSLLIAFNALTAQTAVARDGALAPARELFRLQLPKNVELQLPTSAPNEKAQAIFNGLTPEEKMSFFAKRHKFLSLVASAMAGPRLTGVVISGATSYTAQGVGKVMPPKHWYMPVVTDC
ncbi:MAG: hypothetical protein ACXVA9_02830 [Bdellovibrionales bacterium]